MNKPLTHEPSTHESTVQGREGKTYGYQRPQESMTNGSRLAERKQKVVSAFEEFMDALMPPTGSGTSDTGATGTGGAGAGGGGSAGTGAGGQGGAPTGAYYGTGIGSSGTGAGTSGTGTGGTGAGTAGTGGGQRPSTGPGGEQPLGEAGKTTGSTEAQQMSIFSQREAYRMDRARESTRKARSHESSSPTPTAGGGVQVVTVGAYKHQSDSNRAPLTESKEFAPAFGSTGKSAAPTIEKISVPSRRPETVPAVGSVSTGRPIDAYWASFGTAIDRAAARAKVDVNYVMMESIIGADDRVRVTNNQLYPWRCICSLLITTRTGMQYIGTGWLVSPRLVLTAGHCVYMADEDGWPTQIEVIPGRNGTVRPFGSAIARDFRSVSGWTRDNDSDYDYGAILLPADKRYGEQLGWFGYANRQDDYIRGVTLNLAGYPGDGGKLGSQVEGSQWYNSRGVKDVMDRQVTYEIDTFGGQSGAPVWEMNSNGGRYGLAIHTFGTSVNNGATRITSDVFDNIVLWAGQVP